MSNPLAPNMSISPPQQQEYGPIMTQQEPTAYDIPTVSHRRKWWLALLLHLLGWCGYLYVGRPRRWFLFLFLQAFGLAIFWTGFWGLAFPPMGFLILMGGSIVVSLIMLVDVVRLAHKQPDYELRAYNRWWVYAILLMLGLGPGSWLFIAEDHFALRTFDIPSSSMTPTLQIGDHLIANALAYKKTDPERGDIAIFKLPSNPELDYVKRIVGLPGETIQMKDGQLFINDDPIKQAIIEDGERKRLKETLPEGLSYHIHDLMPDNMMDNTPVYEVPKGHYFVLGDNRDNSTDSRVLHAVGYVPRANIFAKVTGIYLASDSDRTGTIPN